MESYIAIIDEHYLHYLFYLYEGQEDTLTITKAQLRSRNITNEKRR